MEFNPNNHIVRLCLQGLYLEEQGKPEEAGKVFLQAWDEAGNHLEKFITAHYVTRYQINAHDKLKWAEITLKFAQKMNKDYAVSVFPSLYLTMAKCYEDSGYSDRATEYYELAKLSKDKVSDKGPFYHGTRADLKVGDLLKAGGNSNYKEELKMNHIYFTALLNGAGLAAALANGVGRERVYIVEPTGSFENDPNVTDKKFPGNPTRSFRSREPLIIVGEVADWVKVSSEEIQKWREKLANNKGEIIN